LGRAVAKLVSPHHVQRFNIRPWLLCSYALMDSVTLRYIYNFPPLTFTTQLCLFACFTFNVERFCTPALGLE